MTHFWACTPTYFFRQFWPTILGAADDTSEPPRERRQMTARLQTTKEAVTDNNPFKCNYYIFFVTHVAYSDQIQTVRKGRAGRLADVPDGLLQSSLFQLYANSMFSCQLTTCLLTLLCATPISWIHSIPLTCSSCYSPDLSFLCQFL